MLNIPQSHQGGPGAMSKGTPQSFFSKIFIARAQASSLMTAHEPQDSSYVSHPSLHKSCSNPSRFALLANHVWNRNEREFELWNQLSCENWATLKTNSIPAISGHYPEVVSHTPGLKPPHPRLSSEPITERTPNIATSQALEQSIPYLWFSMETSSFLGKDCNCNATATANMATFHHVLLPKTRPCWPMLLLRQWFAISLLASRLVFS